MIQNKIVDTSTIPNSRADIHWYHEGFKSIYKSFRKGVDIPEKLRNVDNAEKVQHTFKFSGFQFGNWLNNNDRYNYLCALYIACYDLNKVLKIGNNIGLQQTLSVSFGARGSSSAVAHFEASQNVINITRYSEGDSFINSGGIGAFAHEYGHFLDFYLGRYYAPVAETNSLTGGRSTNRKEMSFNMRKNKLRTYTEQILQIAYWKTPYSQESDYMKRIEAVTESEYFFRRTEIFARIFEQYISFKLQKMGIYNKFLSETKYKPIIYMRSDELKRVVPLFDAIVKELQVIAG